MPSAYINVQATASLSRRKPHLILHNFAHTLINNGRYNTQLLLPGDPRRLRLQLFAPWLLHHKIDDGYQFPVLNCNVSE